MNNFHLLFFLFPIMASCHKEQPLFQEVKATQSGLDFNNEINQNDTLNPVDIVNVYNGGGVGVGDFNNDGRPDIFFAGNLVSCRLYLNKGKMKFRDVTEESGATGEGKWCTGVSVVDINNDGWMDIYVCASLKKYPRDRKNMLYINLGSGEDQVPHFKEMANEYGLDDSCHSVHAAFFDYDNDEDLDMYLGVNEITESVYRYMNHPPINDGLNPSTGRLYRNDRNDSLKHPYYTNVSAAAGIKSEGYSNAIYITDINRDGWKDIYVSNDFMISDFLWINNHDGTFTDKIGQYFKHITANAMGCDMGDINNDGLLDMVELDMSPEDNYRRKMMLQSNKDLQFTNGEGYMQQYSRNSLQLNLGPRILENDTVGDPVFMDIGFMAGIEATDWSWGPLIADFDQDGNADILIHNGFPKDITDRDFSIFMNRFYLLLPKDQILSQIPAVKLHNYAFRNLGNLRFENVSASWGFKTPTFTNGTAYADFDGDGDLDLVMNNINDKALLYKNTSVENEKIHNHYLAVRLKGPPANRNGIGTWVEIYYNGGNKQVWESNPYKGYLSTVDNMVNFGLGSNKNVDSVIIRWSDGKMQVLTHVPVDKTLQPEYMQAEKTFNFAGPRVASGTLLKNVTRLKALQCAMPERLFNDFGIQHIMPHKYSDYGPALAAGDLNNDGLDDFICGGTSYQSAILFFQQKDGRFIQQPLMSHIEDKQWKDEGLLLFDADLDGDLDLYIASGGYENLANTVGYQDHFFANNGHGVFSPAGNVLPLNYTSKMNVRAADIDMDGDLDLLVTGRIETGRYPKPVSSFVYRNDTERGKARFTDVTANVAASLQNAGLVSDALFTDFNNDGWPDIILAGEWMPLVFLQNEKGTFTDITASTGTGSEIGWWNSLVAGDFDNDGDMDYIAGNLGLNSYYKASDQYPVSVYAGDFNNSGRYYAFLSQYFQVNNQDNSRKEFPAQARDDIMLQMNSLSRKFPDYKSFARASMQDIFTPEQLKNVLILRANNFRSCFVRNEGNGHFSFHALPPEAQVSMLNGMFSSDFNNDGNLDVIVTGNDFGMEASVGRMDALNGLLLLGNGKGDFTASKILQSGLFIPGNSKAVVSLRSADDKLLLVVSRHNGELMAFEPAEKVHFIELRPFENSAILKYHQHRQRFECHWGNSFLSQSVRMIAVGKDAISAEIMGNKGQKRTIEF